MAASLEFWLYLPQMRLSLDQLVERARNAEAAGFDGIAGMDHMAPPRAEDQPMFEAMISTTWLAAHTSRLSLGSLVLCDSFRHPAQLAREAVSLDHASGGRFELGLGWGSVAREFDVFGVGSTEPRFRVSRLKESLDIITALWRGEPFDYEGEHFTLHAAQQRPTPITRIPIVIGGAGRKTMELVATYADWWNLHVGILDRYDELRPQTGRARPSLQVQTALIASEDRREEIVTTARRRFGSSIVAGSPDELVDYFGSLGERGVERIYVWFTDFAPAETVAEFGASVIGALRALEA
jgi:alkanesulfonate monooxygenase SsuD/methylene tetrahydromethanopterin reductase-like flavin-dependent oxidoreductase (luciferase family)